MFASFLDVTALWLEHHLDMVTLHFVGFGNLVFLIWEIFYANICPKIFVFEVPYVSLLLKTVPFFH